MIAYKLMEQECPFPEEKIRTTLPLLWKLSKGLGCALSTDPGCQFFHLFTMGSLRLNCLKMGYSGLLGVFPNILVTATGASGDGKSVPLWFTTQVCHYFKKWKYQKAKAAWDDAKERHDRWKEDKQGVEPPHPGKEPKEEEEVYDGGSTHGLGQQMSETQGRGFLLKHEGKKMFLKWAEGGPAGSFEDINQLCEHCFCKNNPLTTTSKYRVENPHLVAFILMHLEELVPLLESDDDSVGGLMRFLFLHFPPKVGCWVAYHGSLVDKAV